MIRRLCALVALCFLTGCTGLKLGPDAIHGIVTVFAASSLQPAFAKIADQVGPKDGLGTYATYAGSQMLLAQLEQGAQADVFASADTAHMNQAEADGLLTGPPQVFAHNKLEIAVERGNPKQIHGLADLSRAGLVVVLADPSVPAGKYAQQALAKAHVTVRAASLEPQVTGVLTKVALGEADAGVVYVSDIVTSGKVDGVSIPDDQNVIAGYPIAGLKSAPNPAGAKTFIDYVLSPDGQDILKAAGFQGA